MGSPGPDLMADRPFSAEDFFARWDEAIELEQAAHFASCNGCGWCTNREITEKENAIPPFAKIGKNFDRACAFDCRSLYLEDRS